MSIEDHESNEITKEEYSKYLRFWVEEYIIEDGYYADT